MIFQLLLNSKFQTLVSINDLRFGGFKIQDSIFLLSEARRAK